MSKEAEFWPALREFKARFPMVHLDVWTPGDFLSAVGDADVPLEHVWADPRMVEVVAKLERQSCTDMDWERLRDAVRDVCGSDYDEEEE